VRRSEQAVGALVVLAAIAAGFALKWTAAVSAPFAFAFFSALVLNPVRQAVSRRVPRRVRWLGVAAAVLLLLLAYAVVLGATGLAGAQVARELPRHVESLGRLLAPIRSLAAQVGIGGGEGGGGGLAESIAQGGASAVTGATGFLVLSVFFVTLMLSEAGQWRRKIQHVLRGRGAARVLDAGAESTSSVRRYLLALTLVGLATAVLEGGFLLIVGVELALVWALLFFVLNFIPYVGSVLAALPPILFASRRTGPGAASSSRSGSWSSSR
jgi:predicted PurR-regulated permease PerM